MAAIETTILFLVFAPLPFRRIPSETANHRPPTFFTLSVVSHGPLVERDIDEFYAIRLRNAPAVRFIEEQRH